MRARQSILCICCGHRPRLALSKMCWTCVAGGCVPCDDEHCRCGCRVAMPPDPPGKAPHRGVRP